ncbi:hypothetical protein ABEB36_004917 [Hypothenemus hampei]|uniref:Serpin domain-containing protein n=1 Tax=Hypothenemus hampei TaxID=57062 RepID=A0ABD1EWA2_HYPHA
MKIAHLLLVAILATLAHCNDQVTAFSEGNLKFTSNLYKKLLETTQSSFLVSPFSIQLILALVREGAKGKTASEITTALDLPDVQSTHACLNDLFAVFLQKNKDLELLSSNKVFLADQFAINKKFQTVAVDIYRAGIENIDISKPLNAAQQINQWVESQTNKKIKDLISPRDISQSTKIILVNTLYFNGLWQFKFTRSESKEMFYTSPTNQIPINYLTTQSNFRYYESNQLKAKFLELPYKGTNITMTIVLPFEIDGLQSLENNLDQLLQPQPFTEEQVLVKIPPVQVESRHDLKEILKKLGVSTLFSDIADLGNLSPHSQDLSVSGVIQKTFINITETGTEAAAATVVHGVLLSAYIPEATPVNFVADHPFIYYIRLNNVTLFLGVTKQF